MYMGRGRTAFFEIWQSRPITDQMAVTVRIVLVQMVIPDKLLF